MRNMLGSIGATLALGILSGACGDSQGSSVEGGNGNGNGNGTGGSGVVLGGGSGSGSGSGVPGSVITPEAACATGTASANLSAVNMFVMFDRSSSMNERRGNDGPSRWEMASAALTSFFADPEAAGLKLALRFFPHDLPQLGCNGEQGADLSCNVDACAAPLVPLGTLTAAAGAADAQEAALLSATTASAPGMAGQGTPISAALGGALQWAAAQRRATPAENSVVVLVTDGEANGCEERINAIAGLASSALAADEIRTYAIGLTGSQEADMDRIAAAGGTTRGIFVADGDNAQTELKTALGNIRGQVLDCDFPLPEPRPGVDVDPQLINVNYTPGGGTVGTLTQVAGAAQCSGSGSWYYDDPSAPTRIVLCPATCDTVTGDAGASLQILLGCPSSSEVPR
jgi:hypothetical protein